MRAVLRTFKIQKYDLSVSLGSFAHSLRRRQSATRRPTDAHDHVGTMVLTPPATAGRHDDCDNEPMTMSDPVPGESDDSQVMIVDPDDDAAAEGANVTDLVNQPAKVMRIGNMIRQLLEEVRSAPLDEAGRARLKEIHAASVKELESGLSPELVDELERITLPFSDSEVPSESELRIAQAQLVGWLEGLFHGIQTALVAQQMAAHAQLEQMRRALAAGNDP